MFFIVPWKLEQANGRKNVPLANATLIAVNVLLWLLGRCWVVGPGTGPLSVVLYGFSHFGIWHLALNMWALWIFGNPVNRRLGNGFYLLMYLGTIVLLGLFARLVLSTCMAGSSGALFAVIASALILMPSAVVRVACVALFPLTIVVGLLSRPRDVLHWIVRGRVVSMPALWFLLMIPLMQLWSFFWHGWSWAPVAHLLGMICGVVFVAMLPSQITLGRRSAVERF
ncbi:MAG TPA: rhomboid family intramembrane serine protease [Thermoguttaceae bacterium]|nr:rhomboid family intramembrane serine protease [Thermoguttaceae bacterium]